MAIKESLESENIWIQILIFFAGNWLSPKAELFCFTLINLSIGLRKVPESANRVLSPVLGRNNSCSHTGQ